LIQIGAQPAIVFDTALASDFQADPKEIAQYRKQFEKVIKLLADNHRPAWMFTHKPFWLATGGRIGGDPGLSTKTHPVLTAAAAPIGKFQKAVSSIFAGHVHAFQALQFEDKRTSQFVVGNGGTDRDEVSVPVDGRTKDGRMIESALVLNDFGFVVLEAQENQKWKVKVYNLKGEVSHQMDLR
jgi:hypothetical protein